MKFGWQKSVPSLDIFTICTGREDYLPQQFNFLKAHRASFRKHIFVSNGYRPSDWVRYRLKRLGSTKHHLDRRLPVGACIQAMKHHFTADHTLKLDDDALPLGERFFEHLHALRELLPEHVFSPFPVGLISNLAGPRIIGDQHHSVVYSLKSETFYTLRPVQHVGGFARVSPSAYYRDVAFNLKGHREDSEFSEVMTAKGISMVYTENAFVVEHAETMHGQKQRNPAYEEMKAKQLQTL